VATTNTDIIRVLKRILDQLKEDGSGTFAGWSSSTTISLSAVVNKLDELLTSLQAIDIDADQLPLIEVSVDAVKTAIDFWQNLLNQELQSIDNRLATIDSDTGAIRSDADATRIATQASAVDLAANEIILGNIKSNTDPSGGNSAAALLASGTLMAGGALQSAGGATLGALMSGESAGPLTTIDTSLNNIETDVVGQKAILTTVNTSLNEIESDIDQIRISTASIAASVISVGSSHTLNWLLDFTVDVAGTVIITLVCPTGQKMTNCWMSIHMPVQTNSDETVSINHHSAGDDLKRLVDLHTFNETTIHHHSPQSRTDHQLMDGSSYPLTIAAGEKLVFTFSSLTAADEFHMNFGCDLRDATVVAASTKAGTATITIDQEDHEEIA